MLGTPPAFVLSQDQTLVFNPFESQKLSLPSSKLILELTVFFLPWLVKITVRVLLDSVSFSRISFRIARKWRQYTSFFSQCQHLFYFFFRDIALFFVIFPNVFDRPITHLSCILCLSCSFQFHPNVRRLRNTNDQSKQKFFIFPPNCKKSSPQFTLQGGFFFLCCQPSFSKAIRS